MVAISGTFGSFNALMNLQRSQAAEAQTIARLTNGERIQSAADAPTQLALANDLRSEILSLRSLKRSHFEGVTAIQLADENLEQVTNSLYRAAELATQAGSTTNGGDNSAPKQALNIEFQEILADINQLNDSMRYNEVSLFASGGASFTVNATTDLSGGGLDSITVTFSSFDTTTLGLTGTDLLTLANANTVIDTVVNAIETLSRQRGRLGATQQRLVDNMDNIDEKVFELTEQEIDIRGADAADESVNLTRYDIINRSNISVLAQSGLNPDSVFQLLS